MKARYLALGMGLGLLILAASVIHSQESSPKPAIDPEAETVLRALSEHNKQVKNGVFRLADTIDDVQADGRKLQFAHVRVMTVARPDKLKVDVMGDVTNRTLWLDGKTLTVLDKNKNVYAQLENPGTIDQAIDMLQEKYNMSLPGSDLLTADVYKSLTEGCSAINYIGLGLAGEEKCHHLAFTRDSIDYQMWISLGDAPTTRKIVITYKQMPGQPQYTLQLIKAEEAGKIKESTFACEIPKGADKIKFHPVDAQK